MSADTPQQTYELKVCRDWFDVSRDNLLAACEMSEDEAKGIPDDVLVRIAQKQIAANIYLDKARKRMKT
jgi:hypothetical protein